MKPGKRTIFHIDMDAFFASVEQRDFPHYKNRPVIVGAKVGTRGVVSAASYEARTYGIRSAMPIGEAFRRCPDGVFVQPRMDVYEAVSCELMDIFAQYSPLVEQISVDEAFLDMTGGERLFGTPVETAQSMAEAICKKLRLTASIGIAPNKLCAKIASDCNKPRGITVAPMEPQPLAAWLAPMGVRTLWGVGIQTAAVFDSMGIRSIGDLQTLALEKVVERFGNAGQSLYYLARGIDNRSVTPGSSYKSLSREHTFPSDSASREAWQSTVFTLTQDVARRARFFGVKGTIVSITYRRPDFTRHSKQKQLYPATDLARPIYEGAMSLLETVQERSLRLIGVGISGFDLPEQLDLFAPLANTAQLARSERAADLLVSRFGTAIIKKGRELTKSPQLKSADQHLAQKKKVSHNKHNESTV